MLSHVCHAVCACPIPRVWGGRLPGIHDPAVLSCVGWGRQRVKYPLGWRAWGIPAMPGADNHGCFHVPGTHPHPLLTGIHQVMQQGHAGAKVPCREQTARA